MAWIVQGFLMEDLDNSSQVSQNEWDWNLIRLANLLIIWLDNTFQVTQRLQDFICWSLATFFCLALSVIDKVTNIFLLT